MPSLPRSFLPIPPDSPFPLQNLPLGVFRPRTGGLPRVGTAIGEWVLDLSALDEAGYFSGTPLAGQALFARPSLNAFLALGRPAWSAARAVVSRLLSADEPALRDDPARLPPDQGGRARALIPQADVEMLLPAEIGDYTDFYASREHATHVGALFRPDSPLLPNWLHLPVAYHGRASSVVVSGTPVRRPRGQFRGSGGSPVFGPTQALDYELELGCLVGPGNPLGEPIPAGRAAEHIFGLLLVNDWSARDIQRWEYQPLGPFLGKNFATSISPWVVPLEALEPFRVPGPPQDPEPLPYLRSPGGWAFDIHLEAWLEGEGLAGPQRICATNFRGLYWSVIQQLAHHTVGGCNLRPGDLLASGTVSGPEEEARACLLERTRNGTRPLQFPGGAQRTWLQDGDEVTLTAWAQGDGYRVGFGEVRGKIGASGPG